MLGGSTRPSYVIAVLEESMYSIIIIIRVFSLTADKWGYSSYSSSKHKACVTFVQYWSNVEDVGPTLYKVYKCFVFAGHTVWWLGPPDSGVWVTGDPIKSCIRHWYSLYVRCPRLTADDEALLSYLPISVVLLHNYMTRQ